MDKKNAKLTKRSHTYKALQANVEILNSYDPTLQLKDTEYAIIIKLINLFTELKPFKFLTKISFRVQRNRKWWQNDI